jgi:GNAT superfamily N-acetyltransferase
MLEGRDDLAVLWALRVHPDYRSEGVGHQLFKAAVARAVYSTLLSPTPMQNSRTKSSSSGG